MELYSIIASVKKSKRKEDGPPETEFELQPIRSVYIGNPMNITQPGRFSNSGCFSQGCVSGYGSESRGEKSENSGGSGEDAKVATRENRRKGRRKIGQRCVRMTPGKN